MTQINAARYTVQQQEMITVRVESIATGAFHSAAIDGSVLAPVTTNPLTYSFAITGLVDDEQDFDFAGAFDAGAPPNAHYELFVTGDRGGGEFLGPWYQQGSLGAPITIEFEVSA